MKALTGILLLLIAGRSAAADHGVILLYHHVSNKTPAATSVSPQQFEEHLQYLEDHDVKVMALSDLLQAVFIEGEVPDNAVAITFDDAYRSVYTEAFPRLRDRGWPFTVFVADQSISGDSDIFMSWDQMREMVQAGGEFGGHSSNHPHLVHTATDQRAEHWRNGVIQEIAGNITRLERELNVPVTSFAYPYGEFTAPIQALVEQRGLYGLGQQSGAIGPSTPKTAIPRFPMMRSMASLERLELAINSRPLPVRDVDAGPVIRRQGDPAGVLTFYLDHGAFERPSLHCFSASGDPLPTEYQGRQVRVQLPVFKAGRNKVNCTAAANDQSGDYFWWAQQWLVTQADGSWPAE